MRYVISAKNAGASDELVDKNVKYTNTGCSYTSWMVDLKRLELSTSRMRSREENFFEAFLIVFSRFCFDVVIV